MMLMICIKSLLLVQLHKNNQKNSEANYSFDPKLIEKTIKVELKQMVSLLSKPIASNT